MVVGNDTSLLVEIYSLAILGLFGGYFVWALCANVGGPPGKMCDFYAARYQTFSHIGTLEDSISK